MANYALTKKVIDDNIRRNGRRTITGPVLNAVLTQMLSTLGIGGYKLGGVVSPGDTFVPGDADMFFVATQPGTYADFGGFVLNEGEIGFLSFNGEWHSSIVSLGGGSVDAYTKAESDAKFATNDAVQELSGNVGDISTNLASEIQRATGAEIDLSHRIDTIVQGRNVRDIVGNYAELEAYDTSTLGDNDIVMVLLDNTKSGHTTYYRWKQTEGEWEFIGGLAFTYTKTEIDAKFSALHIVLPTIPADAEAHPENYQELLAQVDTMVRGAGADASFKMPIVNIGNVDVTLVKTNPAHIYLGVFADDRSYLYHIARTTSTPRTYTCAIIEKVFATTDNVVDLESEQTITGDKSFKGSTDVSEGVLYINPDEVRDVDNDESLTHKFDTKADADIVITLPFVDEESSQAMLKQVYDKVRANPNAVFRFDNGFLATAFVDDLNQVILQYREGNEVVQMVIADHVGTYVLARDVVALADVEELAAVQTKVNEKAKVTPTLQSGTQIATITTENAEGQAVETPLYAPQGGGGSDKEYLYVAGQKCRLFTIDRPFSRIWLYAEECLGHLFLWENNGNRAARINLTTGETTIISGGLVRTENSGRLNITADEEGFIWYRAQGLATSVVKTDIGLTAVYKTVNTPGRWANAKYAGGFLWSPAPGNLQKLDLDGNILKQWDVQFPAPDVGRLTGIQKIYDTNHLLFNGRFIYDPSVDDLFTLTEAVCLCSENRIGGVSMASWSVPKIVTAYDASAHTFTLDTVGNAASGLGISCFAGRVNEKLVVDAANVRNVALSISKGYYSSVINYSLPISFDQQYGVNNGWMVWTENDKVYILNLLGEWL